MAKATVYLPDELYQRVQDSGVPISPTCQRALEQEVSLKDTDLCHVKLWDAAGRTWKAAFKGRWLIDPTEGQGLKEELGGDFTSLPGWYRVAITAKGAFFCYAAPLNEASELRYPFYDHYRTLGDALNPVDWDGEYFYWPKDIIHAAADNLGMDIVVTLDI